VDDLGLRLDEPKDRWSRVEFLERFEDFETTDMRDALMMLSDFYGGRLMSVANPFDGMQEISINGFYKGVRGVLISQILPGNNVDESITVETYLTREEPTSTDHDEVAQIFDFLGRVVSTEDLPTSHAQQRALSTGMLTSIRLGRNEGGLQQFHRWTDTLLNIPDTELNELFRNGIDH